MTAVLRSDEPGISVSPWIVLMAFRYGLNRATVSHRDALALVRANWHHLQQFGGSIISDLEDCVENPHPSAPENSRSAAELLQWIAHQTEASVQVGV